MVKYFPGDVFDNAIAIGLSQIVGILLVGSVYKKISIKMTYFAFMCLGAFGVSLILLYVSENNEKTFTFPFFVFLAHTGISACFVLNYYTHSRIFPTLYASTAMGLCNTFARIGGALAPFFVEIPNGFAVKIVLLLIFGSVIAIYFLEIPLDHTKE
jgi:FtsH-binding integral membrane protein